MPTVQPAYAHRSTIERSSFSLWISQCPGWLAAMMACVCLLGCRKAQEPVPVPATNAPPSTTAISTNAVSKFSSPAAAVQSPASNAPPVETQITILTAPFKSAPPATQARIDEALQSFKAGKKREAITKLKLVDADTELTAEQQQSVKELITVFRE